MSMEFWQAGGIPPTVIRGGGNLEHWRAGGIPAMMATPTFSLTIQGAVHAHTVGNVVLVATAPASGSGSLEFPSAFAAWWPSWFGSGGGGGGSASPPPPDPSLDFSLENNSGYIALIGGF